MKPLREFLKRIKTSGARRPGSVRTTAMGVSRIFDAYDIGDDTFIFERGISALLHDRPSVLVVEKRRLRKRGGRGRVFTMTSGNHSVAAFPLLDGRFWKLSNLPAERRGEVLMSYILCSNVVNDAIEVSQRDISTEDVIAHDLWLRKSVGLSMADVIMGDRNEVTLEHYRKRGEEWRVKPLAWTEGEMRAALSSSRKRMASKLNYYHSARGVHFLTFPEFERFSSLAQTDPEEFLKGLKELVGVYEGNRSSFTRMPKYRGHHEIEFFGLKRGLALESIVPAIEKLMEAVALGKLGQLGVIQRTQEIVDLYRSQLTRPEFSDEKSKVFVESVYMHVTGEVYSVIGEGVVPAFDDRRTALPGATFVDGRLSMHPGADMRTELLFSNLRGLLSKGEFIEYANVYELREEGGNGRLGCGSTREVVYKTNIRPLEASLIEKCLSSSRKGYSDYLLARIGALRAIGVGLSSYYRILKARAGQSERDSNYFIRMRCEGEPMDSIPANYFHSADDASGENADVVRTLAMLMGDAAAQTMAMKKFDPKSESPLYGVGKEIYEFEYDLLRETVVPKHVRICSIRGSFGWPDLEQTDENLSAIGGFYLTHFAHALKGFQRRHKVPMSELAESFMNGFEFRTHAMAWQLSIRRDSFENFHPPVLPCYGFDRKWKFMTWSLDRQERRLPLLRRLFYKKLEVIENEDLRYYSE